MSLKLESVALGSQGLRVSRLGLGCMGMSEFYAGQDDAESLATLHKALDLGLDFLDTADMYGPFKNEELLGRALAGKRGQVVLATKFGNQRGQEGQFLGVNGSPDYVRQCCEDSLRRLKVDVIDLYYQHRVDPKTPIEDTVGAMAALVKAGKVRYLGLSEAASATLRRAVNVHPISALQTEYSLWSRDPEGDVLDTARELGVGFVAYSPLGRGFLTGRFQKPEDLAPDDFRSKNPRFQAGNFTANLKLAAAVQAMAAKKDATAAQVALAWLLAQGKDVVPIPGTTKRTRLVENLGAVDLVLGRAELEELDRACPKGAAVGQRYADMGTVNR